MLDGERLDLGRHKLRFLETSHVHHWEPMLAFEETTGSLFPADLFVQSGDQPAVVEETWRKTCSSYIAAVESSRTKTRYEAPLIVSRD